MTPLQCVSAAHQAGRTQILAEMYACSTENLTFRDQKYMFDHFAALGINHRSIHGIFYSLDGRRKRFFPPHINYYQPYWNDYRMLTDYCAQASWFISQGKPCRDILVIHPMGSGTSEYSPWGGPLQRDTEFLQLTQQLVHHQCEFELGDEDTLAQWGKIDGRQLQLGEMSYKYVVLPNLKIIAGTTLKLLTEFAAAGGTIFTLGQSPYLLDGIEADFILPESVQAKDSADLISLLKQYSTDYKLDTAIILNHRRDQQYDYFFLFNSDCSKPRKVKLDVPGKFIFPESNEFEIPEGGSVMILVDHTAPALPAKTQTMNAQIHPLSDVWNLKRNAPNVLLLEYASYRKADGEYSKIYPIIAIQDILQAENYDGDLTLRFEFDSDITLNHAQLAIEHPKEQQIRLNGHEISNLPDGYFLATQFQVLSLDIPVKPGKNIIEINRHFKPLSKARSVLTSLFDAQHGTELEALFLLGDFGVFSLEEASPRTPCIRMNHHFRLAPEPSHFTGELVNNGYPFYTGSVDLTQDFYLTAEQAATKAELYIEDINACLAEVLINGVPQGKIAWYPNSFPLNNLQTGLNTITVRLTNTLRNLLGPFHRPKGEYGSIFGGYGSALSWTGLVNEDTLEPIPDWYDHRIPDTNAWTEEYMLIPFGLRKAAIQS